MTGSNEFSMLNIDINSRLDIEAFVNQDSYIEFDLEIGPQIEIEKRKVTSLPSLFGEIGGLNDFFASFIVFIISGFQANSFILDSIKRLFLIKQDDKGNRAQNYTQKN